MNHHFLRLSALLLVLMSTTSLVAQSYFSHPYWVTESSMTVTLTADPPVGSVLNVSDNVVVGTPVQTLQVGDSASGDVITFTGLEAGQDYYLRLLDGSNSVLQTRRLCTQFASWPTANQSTPVLAAEMESFSSGTDVENIGSSGPATFSTNGLTISSETPSPMFSGSMDFQSNGDKLRIPGSTMNDYMNANGNWTISMWIRPTVVTGDQFRHSIFSWEGPNGKNMTARQGDNGRIQIVIGEPGQAEQSQTSGPVLTAGKWYHFAAAYQGGDDRMRIFLDGNLILSPDFGIQILNGWTHDFEIGGNPSFDDRSFRGQICGFTFHNNFIYPSGGLSATLDPYVRRHMGKYMNWDKPFDDGSDYYLTEDSDNDQIFDGLGVSPVSCSLDLLTSCSLEATTHSGTFPGPGAPVGAYDFIANPITESLSLHDFDADVTLNYKATDIDGLEHAVSAHRVIAALVAGNAPLVASNPSVATPALVDQVVVGADRELDLSGTFKLNADGLVHLEDNAALRLGTFSAGDPATTYTSTLNLGGVANALKDGNSVEYIMEVPVSGTGWHGISLPFYTEDSEDPSNSAGFNMYLGDDLVEVNSTTAPNLYMWGHESFDYGWNAKSADEFAYIATHAFAGLKHGAIAYFGGTGGVATGAGPWTLEMRGEYTMGYGNPRYLKLQDVSSSEWFASETAEASSRWVLLGNSELCTIGSTNFFNQATDGGTFGDKLTNVLYVYDSSTQGWSAADFVAPGQAFLVKGLQDAGVSGSQLVLTAYTHGGICVDNAVTFKEEMDILQLEVTGMAVAGDKAQIIADANATLGFDERWDALQMGLANASNLFVMDDGVYLDRNHAALPSGMAVTMDLGFYAPVAGTYSISLNDELMASERRVEIENPETGEILNLSNGSFEFEYASADEVVSWVLHIDRLGHLASADFNSELSGEASVGIEENFQEVQGLQVVCADGTLQLTIQGQERDCRWMGGMFDASGKKVMDLDSQGSAQWQVAFSSTMPKGVYHIQLASPGQAPLTAKVILN